MAENEQTVTEQTDEQPAAVSEETGAQDIDALLAEFDTEDTETKADSSEDGAPDDLRKELRELKEQFANELTRRDVAEVVSHIKGDLEVDDDLVQAYLDVRVRKTPALAKAFANRFENPAAWSQIEKKLGEELSSKFVRVDKEATETREAVAAAVRTTATKAPAGDDLDISDIRTLSDAEFERRVKEIAKQMGGQAK